MKRSLLILVIILFAGSVFAKIDNRDTVVFDLSKAVVTAAYFEVPVYFLSTDTILAIDFAMKYDLTKISYNSILKYQSSTFNPLAHYDSSDSTLRFSSYSIPRLPNDSNIFWVKFNFLNSCGQTSKSDFNVLYFLLNGTMCSYKLTTPVQYVPLANFYNNRACTGLKTNFRDSSQITGGTITGRYWNFGNGDTASSKDPEVSYASPGNYRVKLIVTSNKGCTDSLIRIVSVNVSPAAHFSSLTNCQSDSAIFSDQSTLSSGKITTWSWNFGDKSISTLEDPIHIYASGGKYAVTLSATSDSVCSSSYLDTVVLSAPSAGFTTSSGCTGSLVNFRDSSVSNSGIIMGWSWSFGDGNTATVQNPAHIYTKSGVYTASLKITTTKNCTDSIRKMIVIEDKPVVKFGGNPLSGCAPLAVLFSDSSVTSPGSLFYWNFGDSDTSFSMNKTHSYLAGGLYTVRHIVTTSNGCADSLVKKTYIQVTASPLAKYTTENGCTGSTISFRDNSTFSSGSISNWTWHFGDGDSSSLQNPFHIYTNAGTYTTILKITANTNCIDTLSKKIIIQNFPIVKFGADPLSGCAPLNVQFTDSSIAASGSRYFWNFGDQDTSGSISPTHSYTTTGGKYTVRHIVTTPVGCTDSMVKAAYITVISAPIAAFADANGCLGAAVNFKDNSSVSSGTITSWNWDFGDGNKSTQQDPSYIYSGIGTYKVSLKVGSANGCTDTISNTLVIQGKPNVKFGADVLSGCSPLSVTFTDSSLTSSGSKYFWSFGDTDTSSSKSSTHLFMTDTVYTIRHIVTTSAGCTDSLVKNAYIKVFGGVQAKFTAGNGCKGSDIKFTDNSSATSGKITAWNWYFGDGNTSPQQNPLYAYGISGTYTVSLKITANKHCMDSTSQTIIIQDIPDVNFGSNLITGCIPLPVNFRDSSLAAIGSGYYWNFGDSSTSSLINASHTYLSTGIYSVKHLVITSAGCKDSLTKSDYIKIADSPNSLFKPSEDTVKLPNALINFKNLSNGNSDWYWNFGDSTYSSVKIPEHSYASPGIYKVCLSAKNSIGCISTYCDSVTILFPNRVAVPGAFTPNGDNLNDILLVRGGPMEEMDFRLFNEWGNQVFQSVAQIQGWDGNFRGAPQPEGSYEFTLKGKTTDHQTINMYGVVNLLR